VSAQLALDALPEWRTRDGWWPPEAHQRGWVRLPYNTGGGDKAGDILPAYVCCRCGGVELSAWDLDRGHGCCTSWMRTDYPCCRLNAAARHRRLGVPVRRWRLDDAWASERPP
jgi:hypothetical protein